jgi:hypothetical protein
VAQGVEVSSRAGLVPQLLEDRAGTLVQFGTPAQQQVLVATCARVLAKR